MTTATVGALRVVLGIDTASFEKGLTGAQKHLRGVSRQMESTGNRMMLGGAGMTATITAPFIAMGFAAIRSGTEARNALGQVESALTSMGAASGKTLRQLQDEALELRSLSVFDDDDILTKITANMLTFGNVSGDAFSRAQLAAVNLSARMGGDLQASALMVGKALNAPIQGLTAMRRVGIQFTEQQEAQIRAMVKVGDLAGAQAIMLGELERQFGGAAQAARDADPWSANRDKWRDMEGTFERIALDVVPPLLAGVGSVMDAFNNLTPAMQSSVIGAIAIAAALGPVVTVMGGVLTGAGAIVGVMGRMQIAKTGAAGGAGLLARSMVVLRASMMFLVTTPWGLLITGVAVAVGLLALRNREAAVAARDYQLANEALAQATDAYEAAANAAAIATGREGVAARQAAAEKRALAIAARDAARAKLAEAQATIALIQAEAGRMNAAERFNIRGDRPGSLRTISPQQREALAQAQANYEATVEQIGAANASIAQADRAISARAGGGGAPAAETGGTGGGASSAAQAGQEAEQRRRTVEDMAHALAIEEAQLQNNRERVRELEREEAVRQRTRALIDAGILRDAAAATEAERVQLRLDAALEQQMEREADQGRRAWELDLWRIDGREDLVQQLEREIQLEERVNFWLEKNRDLVTATAMAQSEMAEMDVARAEAAERTARTSARQHDIEVARLRGDWQRERALSRAQEVEARSRDYQSRTDNPLSPAEARRRAEAEVAELDEAEITGQFRRFVNDGWRAAMDGNLSDFAKRWVQDWASRGLEDALNSLGDLLRDLFKNMDFGGGGKSGGGIGGLISGALSMFSPSKMSPGFGGPAIATGMKIPGFKTGGSFTVGGSGGPDSQLMSFMATPGEMVDIRTPGQMAEAGGGSMEVIVTPSPYFDVQVKRVAEPMVQAGEARVRRDVPGMAVGAVADARSRRIIS